MKIRILSAIVLISLLIPAQSFALDNNDLNTVIGLITLFGGNGNNGYYPQGYSNINPYSPYRYNSSAANQAYLNSLSNYNTYQNNPNGVYYNNSGYSNVNGYYYNTQNGGGYYNSNGSYNNSGVVVQQGIPVNKTTYYQTTPQYQTQPQTNQSGYYVTKTKKVWIPETTEKKWVEPKYSQVWNQYTQSYQYVKIAEGYWQEYYIPGHYVEKEVKEFVPYETYNNGWRTY